jgi:TonB family protein
MNQLFSYYIQSFAAFSVVYLVYHILLRRESHFFLNRFWLIAGLVLASTAPLITFSVDINPVSPQISYVLQEITIAPTANIEQSSSLTWSSVLLLIYFAGMAAAGIRFFLRLYKILSIIHKGQKISYSTHTLVFTVQDITPFSFFRWVVVSDKTKHTEMEAVLTHELAHVRQRHSFDIMILEMISVIQWFNPILLLYKQSLKETHEFLADKEVISNGYETILYQKIILAMTLGVTVADLTNNFKTSQIKRRMIMMTKMKPPTFARLKFWLLVPVVTGLVVILACNSSTGEQNDNEPLTEATTDDSDEIFEVVDVMPVFGNSENALNEYIVSHVKYPQDAKEKGIQGKVHVSFVVNQKGKVTDVQVVEPVNELLDAEAIRVISEMPDWKPGTQKGKAVKVKMVLPISFKLS